MVARRHPTSHQPPGRRASTWRRLRQLTDRLRRLPWGAYLSQPGRRQQPLLLNPLQFCRHWRVVQLERCLQLSSSTVRRR
ncbi:MAG: hypothetical protein ACKOCM_03485 [Cyanobacteriota bacterium]